ncbi:MAG: hypothetical protein U0359_08515 [Byssovorax sp.]
MKRTVTWAAVVQADIERMGYLDAQRVCMAVFAFARDGSGRVERVDPNNPRLVRVRTRGGVALLSFTDEEVHIWRMFATPATGGAAR